MSTAIMIRALATIRSYLQAPGNRSAVQAIAKRLGFAGGDTSQIMSVVKNNPVTTALALMEMGSDGLDLLNALRAANPSVQSLLTTIDYEPDDIDDLDSSDDLANFSDEFQTITAASAAVGGMQNLLALRRAMEIDPKVYALRFQVQEMSRM